MRIPESLVSFLTLAALLIACGRLSLDGGGGSEVEVVGYVYFSNGDPASGTQVKLVPQNYNPVIMDMIDDSLIDTTDASGRYTFKGVAPGSYNMLAVHITQRSRLLITGISVVNDTAFVPSGTLLAPGAIRLLLPADRPDGYAFIPGTDIVAYPSQDGSEVLLDSVPAGRVPEVRFVIAGDSSAVTKLNVLVRPGDTITIGNPSWHYAQQVCLNTSVSGAHVERDVLNFPVLVRLNAANFDFTQASANGADIRFTKTGNTFLPHEIEQWDAVNRQAEVWVQVDTVHGDDSTQTIMMYWGNPGAAGVSNSAMVFDTANGFQGVWHLNENPAAGAEAIKDRTANGYNATPYGSMTAADAVDAVVGKGLDFDGNNDYLNAGKVVLTGSYSVGLWVRLNRVNNYQRIIFQDSAYTLWYDSDRSGARMEHIDSSGIWRGIPQDGGAVQPTNIGVWYYLTGTFDGDRVRFYVNGILATTSNGMAVNPASHGYDLLLGQSWNNSYVNGTMDEIRIEKVNRSADWIKLCYINQRSDDKLIVFK
ncbi:MAG: DUF2341 domain-containing protein [Chitinispirillaceae bacterium]|nr:DUF2341 domain-containing protein [Chitinispirillaceae bacterium]